MRRTGAVEEAEVVQVAVVAMEEEEKEEEERRPRPRREGTRRGERERKRGNQEKPKWVSGQVTWRRTGSNVQDGDTLSYSSNGRLGRSRFCLPIQETLRDAVVETRRAVGPPAGDTLFRETARLRADAFARDPLDENRANEQDCRTVNQLTRNV